MADYGPPLVPKGTVITNRDHNRNRVETCAKPIHFFASPTDGLWIGYGNQVYGPIFGREQNQFLRTIQSAT
jgi:hypothetical protein